MSVSHSDPSLHIECRAYIIFLCIFQFIVSYKNFKHTVYNFRCDHVEGCVGKSITIDRSFVSLSWIFEQREIMTIMTITFLSILRKSNVSYILSKFQIWYVKSINLKLKICPIQYVQWRKNVVVNKWPENQMSLTFYLVSWNRIC